jgi:hypothetical protein
MTWRSLRLLTLIYINPDLLKTPIVIGEETEHRALNAVSPIRRGAGVRDGGGGYQQHRRGD